MERCFYFLFWWFGFFYFCLSNWSGVSIFCFGGLILKKFLFVILERCLYLLFRWFDFKKIVCDTGSVFLPFLWFLI